MTFLSNLRIDTKPKLFDYDYDKKEKRITKVIVFPDQKVMEHFIFQAREQIINDLIQQFFEIIEEETSAASLTPKMIAEKLLTKKLWVQPDSQTKPAPLTARQQDFRTYLAQQVLAVLKAPTPPHLRQEIVFAMGSQDLSCIEAVATTKACQLLAQLDEQSPEIVDRLMNNKKIPGKNVETVEEKVKEDIHMNQQSKELATSQ